MSLSQKLERLVRIIPGVAGYQDREASRDTDKAVRTKLAAEIEAQKRELDEDRRRLVERRELPLLARLDPLASKLDRLANSVRYAARGYRGVFDGGKGPEQALSELYDFDLGLFGDVAKIRSAVGAVREAHGDRERFVAAVDALRAALDEFDRRFLDRQHLLS